MKYGKEDYEELLDTAVRFMKRNALYEEYWGSGRISGGVPMEEEGLLSGIDKRVELAEYLEEKFPPTFRGFNEEARKLADALREFDKKDREKDMDTVQRLAWELVGLSEKYAPYKFREVLVLYEPVEDMVRTCYQQLMELAECRKIRKWAEDMLDRMEDGQEDREKFSDACRHMREWEQELKEKAGYPGKTAEVRKAERSR